MFVSVKGSKAQQLCILETKSFIMKRTYVFQVSAMDAFEKQLKHHNNISKKSGIYQEIDGTSNLLKIYLRIFNVT